jgi:hypothetical protein
LHIVGERSHFTNSMLDIDGEHNIHTHLIQWNNEGVTLQDKDIWPARSEGRYDGRCFKLQECQLGWWNRFSDSHILCRGHSELIGTRKSFL